MAALDTALALRARRGAAPRPVGGPDRITRCEDLRRAVRRAARQGRRGATPGSGTVAALERGVHAIGKKVVEEAAESWMAAEHEGARADRRGDLPAALPRAGADARGRTGARGRVPTSVGRSAVVRHVPSSRSPDAAHRRAQQGHPVRPAAADAARGRLPPAHRRPDLVCRDADNEVEFFYLRPRDIATYVGSGDLDLGITGRDLLIDAGAAPRSCSTSASAAPRSASPPGPAPHAMPRPRRAPDRHLLPGRGRRATSPSTASPPR